MVFSFTDEHILGWREVRSKNRAGAGSHGASGCIDVVSVYLAERLFLSCIHERDGEVDNVAYCPGVRVWHN